MSRSVDLFIRSGQPIDEVAEAVGRLIDRSLTPGPSPETWVLREGDVEVLLRVHPYLDDDGLMFSNYRYSMSASVPNDIRLTDSPATELLRRVADRIHRAGTMRALLVLDLQYRDRAAGPPKETAPVGPGSAEGDPGDALPADERPAGEASVGVASTDGSTL